MVRIRISEPRLLPQLIDSLVRADCLARLVDEATCEVVHPFASDEREMWTELRFFLRAWEGKVGGVRTELVA